MVYNAFTVRFGEKARLFEPEFAGVKGAAIYANSMVSFHLEPIDPPSREGRIIMC